MNRQPPVRVQAGCLGKFPYPTQSIANRIAARMRRVRDRALGVYRCDCGSWHVGNSGIIRKKTRMEPYNREQVRREILEEEDAA